MRKNLVFLSLVLTAFVLALLSGVVWAYQEFTATIPAPVVQQTAVATQDSPTAAAVSIPTVAQTTVVSPQDAAAIAAQFLNRKDLYSVEVVAFNGANVYKVSFSTQDVVYVSLSGQLLSFVQAPIAVPQISNPQPNSSGPTAGGGGGGEHDGGGD